MDDKPNSGIEQGNKLIADFMGVEPAEDGMVNIYMDGETMKEFGQEYHSSWDWLMPVVEKIEGFKFEIAIIGLQCIVLDKRTRKVSKITEFIKQNTKIESVWLSVVEFIKWLNNQNK